MHLKPAIEMTSGVDAETVERNTISTHAYPSWEVRPQLQHTSVTIVGESMRAGHFSDIKFEFIPIRRATTFEAMALEPREFK